MGNKRHKEHPKEVIKAIKNGNTTCRIRHMNTPDGSNCSKGKDKAMVITRRADRWVYWCFRCQTYGEVLFEQNTPKTTLSVIEQRRIKKARKEHSKEMHLPLDYVPLTDSSGTKSARNWMWEFGIGDGFWRRYKVGWSDSLQRIIFPIFSNHELEGWIARDVSFIPNKEKVLYKVPKYLIKTKDNDNRMFFRCQRLPPRTNTSTLVIVEDILSAMKVRAYGAGVETLALLNSSVDADYIFKNYRGYELLIWLDDDMRRKSIQQVIKLAQFGFVTKHIFTMQDPKTYGALQIQMFLDGKSKGEIL